MIYSAKYNYSEQLQNFQIISLENCTFVKNLQV